MIDGFAGSILVPDSADYPVATNTYGVLGNPAVIARPTTAADVAAAIGYARAQGLQLAVRSGGHSAFSTTTAGW